MKESKTSIDMSEIIRKAFENIPKESKDRVNKLIDAFEAENELGDSGVTGEHGALHGVALSHTHGSETKTPVERPLPSITQAKEEFLCDKCRIVMKVRYTTPIGKFCLSCVEF